MPASDSELESAARRLGRRLLERRWRLATAESCTGGLVGHSVTGLPGSSDWFVGGIVSYSNSSKQALLGVPHDLLREVGAVSEEVARAMAVGALAAFADADLAVAVTGIAGPDGGTPDKPVGLTFVAAARRDGRVEASRHVWTQDRDGNKRASALAALSAAERLAAE